MPNAYAMITSFNGCVVDTLSDSVREHGTTAHGDGNCDGTRCRRGALIFDTLEAIAFDIADRTVVIHVDGAIFNRRVCGCRGNAREGHDRREIERLVPHYDRCDPGLSLDSLIS